jgi:hypothetical protein
VNWGGLDDRTAHTTGMPVCLEMEIGSSTYDLNSVDDFSRVGHIGAVVGFFGDVDCVYGQGWRAEVDLEQDLAAYVLYGCPDRLAVPLYGGWSPNWGAERKHPVKRALRLSGSIAFKDVRLALFISPYDDVRKGDMDVHEWNKVCVSTRSVCEQSDCDVVMWWDGGPDRPDYAEAEPHVAVFREVFTGFDGITKGR